MENVQEVLHTRIEAAKKSTSLTNKFKTMETDEDRVIFTLDVMHEFNVVPDKKCVQFGNESEKFRREGNRLFISNSLLNGQQCVEVLELYTKSIAYAPCQSEELALAYANRSAVLLKVHKYFECIQDIDRALSLSYPDNLRGKLYVRKVEALISSGDSCMEDTYKEALNWLDKISNESCREKLKAQLKEMYAKPKTFFKQKSKAVNKDPPLPKLSSQNPEIPCASNVIALKYNDHYGRHVVATKNIPPGEVIAVEKPYSLILTPTNMYTHCANCLRVCWASIPCDHCVYAMYCSEECKTKDWKNYHDVECNVFTILLRPSNYNKLDLFSLRLAIQAVREAGSLKDLRDELKEVDACTDPRTKGFSKDGKFYSNKYRTIHSLVTNTEKRTAADLFRRSVDACVILYLLATCSTFFGKKLDVDMSTLAKNRDITFVGGLILRLQQTIPSNIHSFSEERGVECVERGVAAMPFCSLINHGCDPNIVRHSRSGHMIIYATYPIKKGEQILDNYGWHYAMTSKKRRQEKLLKQYYFECDCRPCKEDWPIYFNLPSVNSLVTNPRDLSIIKGNLRKFNTYVDLATTGDVLDKPYIVKDLLKMIQILYDHAPLPCEEMNNVVETLKRVYDLTGNRFDVPTV